jgi:hypothetical protein
MVATTIVRHCWELNDVAADPYSRNMPLSKRLHHQAVVMTSLGMARGPEIMM